MHRILGTGNVIITPEELNIIVFTSKAQTKGMIDDWISWFKHVLGRILVKKYTKQEIRQT
jgi:hypothetical protein